jgi:hypothetical protein
VSRSAPRSGGRWPRARLVRRRIVVHHVPVPFRCAGGGAPRLKVTRAVGTFE